MDQEKKIILISGPTASGKSKLALELSQKIKSQIINADSMQVYKELSILTSRPLGNDLKITKHCLYGFQSVKKNFSVGEWLNLTILKIKECFSSNHIPIIVGGTGLYFKSLTDGLVKIPNIPYSLRNKIRKLHKQMGQHKFFNKLIILDPLAEKFILRTDTQRSIRAYEVKKFTNKSLFVLKSKTKADFAPEIFKKIFINTPREVLYQKIDTRVERMFEDRVIKEVKHFLNIKKNKDLPSNKIIGISEIKNYLEEKMTLDQVKELIKRKTRQYAKRQFTWSRGHMRSWEMIYSSNFNSLLTKVINKIF